MTKVSVQIERSRVPVIWLDASIIFRLARIRKGAAHTDPDLPRVMFLRDQIYELVRAGKLVCPNANQAKEALAGFSDFADALVPLSRGIRARSPDYVQSRQEIKAMEAYVANRTEIPLSFRDLFDSDPAKKLQDANEDSFVVHLVEEKSDESVTSAKRSHQVVHEQWEELRKKCNSAGVKYEEQLLREYEGAVGIRLEASTAFYANLANGGGYNQIDYDTALPIMHLGIAWQHISGPTNDGREFAHFLRSDHYRAVPRVAIRAMMIAKLMTGQRTIKRGDAMDIEHISTFLPYVNVMVVDRAMKNLVQQLGLNHRFGTMCYYIGDQKELGEFFETTRSQQVEDQGWQPRLKPATRNVAE